MTKHSKTLYRYSTVWLFCFLKQFDTIFTAHPKIKKFKNIYREQYFNDWHFGFDYSNKKHNYTFEEIAQMEIPVKSKNISIITSSPD